MSTGGAAEAVAAVAVAAVAVDTSALEESEAREVLEHVAAASGRPADDLVRFGAEQILDAVLAEL